MITKCLVIQLTLPVDGTPVERPLAKRRNLVKSVSEKNMDDTESSTPMKGEPTSESTEVTPAKETSKNEQNVDGIKPSETIGRDVNNWDDPEVESIAQLEEKHNETAQSPSKPTEDGEGNKEMFKKLSPKKSLKEIEEEVARNTAQYDADTLKGDGKAMKRSKVSKETVMKSKAAGALTYNINPTNVTRLMRMVVIICLGAYKGQP